MMITELFQKALSIDSPWFIKSIDFDENASLLDVYIDFKRFAVFMDEKEEVKQAYKAYDTVPKTWRHLNFFQHECYLHARVLRYKRSDGKIRLIPPPFRYVVSGFTLLFEALLIQLCHSMSVHSVSQLTGVSDHKIWRVLDIYIGMTKYNEDWSSIERVGVDETSVGSGHDYITLFVDLQERKTCH